MTDRDKAIKAHMAKIKGETDAEKFKTLLSRWSKQKNHSPEALEETFAARMIIELYVTDFQPRHKKCVGCRHYENGFCTHIACIR